ncbi:MAG: hypothetical protein ACQEWV_31275 [Bacillota bacterium]
MPVMPELDLLFLNQCSNVLQVDVPVFLYRYHVKWQQYEILLSLQTGRLGAQVHQFPEWLQDRQVELEIFSPLQPFQTPLAFTYDTDQYLNIL